MTRNKTLPEETETAAFYYVEILRTFNFLNKCKLFSNECIFGKNSVLGETKL